MEVGGKGGMHAEVRIKEYGKCTSYAVVFFFSPRLSSGVDEYFTSIAAFVILVC